MRLPKKNQAAINQPKNELVKNESEVEQKKTAAASNDTKV